MTLRPPVPSFAETAAAFDRRSGDYDRSGMHREFARQAADAAGLSPGLTLLDLAGGTGLVARAALPALGPDGRAVVLDVSSGMLLRAKQADPRLHVVRGDAHRVPLAAATVDRVICVTALHLFTQPAGALLEAVRVCRAGGRVVFTTWSADGWT
ncbi:MAG: class I SAM-dependent methyltransferase [Mycobacteriales bacterium]